MMTRHRNRCWRPGRAVRWGEHLEPRQLLAGDTVTLNPDQFTVHQNSDPGQLHVLANDVFGPEYAGPAEISAVSFGSEGGRIEISSDRKSIVYAPPADFAGTEQFSYFVDGSFFTSVQVDVQSPLRPDEYQLPPDGQIHRLDVMRNDPFWTGYSGPRRITLVSVTTGESEIQIADDGKSILYRPSELATGRDSFVYIVDDIYSTRVTIDTPEVLKYDEFEVLQNTAAQPLKVMVNDPFWAGYSGPRQITYVSPSSQQVAATIEIASDGQSLLYTPAEDTWGYDSFFYVVDERFEANVSVYVQRPVQDDYVEIDIDSQDHPFDVLSNDQYWSYLQRRYVDVVDRVTSVGPSANGGTVAVQGDGLGVIYSAPPGFSGTDTFTYVANGRFTATVTVQVTRPVRDDYLTVYQDTPNQQLRVLQNDFLGNGYTGPRQLTAVSPSQQEGELAIVGSTIRYTPPDGYVGSDTFSYTVDNLFDANVTLSVAPLAQYDSFNFCPQPNQTYTLRVLSNDYFNRGYSGPGLITSVEVVDGGGQASVAADGRSVTYRPGSQSWASLNYTVDGKYQAQATVWRNNHLLADQIVVDQNADATRVNVLANDFTSTWQDCSAASYSGPRLITSATASDHGGSVRVADDGRSVYYEPASDYYGPDTFTYVVDGTMETTVNVQVVRRVRDDQVRVRPGQTDTLSVLTNDLFGADYFGARQISEVTPSLLGASVAIGPDGRTLLYTAPADASETDTLTYTVDGKLKAQVTVDIRPDGDSPFSQFGSLGEFEDFLIQDALQRYSYQFGQPVYNYWWFGPEDASGGFEPGPVPNGGLRDHSETNVQVAGIDEGDIVEFDADYVYFLTGNDVVIVDAWPAEELQEVSRTPIEGEALAQFLNGDRLTVISQIVQWPVWPGPEPLGVDGAVPDVVRPIGDVFFPYWTPTYQTITTVLDVSDRSHPTLVQRTTMEGRYIQSRGIGDYVYVALANQAVAPGPRIVPDPNWTEEMPIWEKQDRYETEEEYLTRVRANLGEYVAEALPNYSSDGADGQLVRSGLLHEPEDIFRPLSEGASSLVSLVSINVTNNEPGLSGSSGVFTNGATEVYASLEHFYIFENGYQPEDGNVTRILQFDWNQDDGSARFSSAGMVPGYMLNQFSADEYQGNLRVVTTVSHSYSGNWTNRDENDLFVLRDDGGTLEFVGSLQNLGLGETARSVRFMGPRAFLVTFRNVDPLFGLDVSDPANPKSVGHLTLPGFASYMQLIDDNHLLTVGRNTPTGFAGPAQVSLYDVSDLTQPRLVDEHTMERFSQTEAAVDHHAFGYFARHGLLAVPSIRSFIVRSDEDQDGYAETRTWVTENELMVFRIDVEAQPGTNQGVQLVAEIAHDSAVRRSGYIDDKLFSIADNSIHVVDVAAPDTILATAADLKHDNPEPPPPVDTVDVAAAVMASAQSDLATRLSVSPGAIMPVTAEYGQAGWQSVLRVDGNYYRYEGEGSTLQLTGGGFEFGPAGESISWQNPTDAADVNNDGQVAPSDAMLLIDQLAGQTSLTLSNQRVLRQIQDPSQQGGPFWDVNGDGLLSPLDVLLVINRANETAPRTIDTGGLSADDPSTLTDIAAVEAFYNRIQRTAGDANLDGRFNSSDLVLIFQRGKYEDGIPNSAHWDDGDWNGDGVFTTADLILAFTYGQYTADAEKVDAVFAEV